MSNPPRTEHQFPEPPTDAQLRRFTFFLALGTLAVVALVIVGLMIAKRGENAAAAKRQADIEWCQRSFGDSEQECASFIDRAAKRKPQKSDSDHINDAARSLDNYCAVRPEKC